VPVDSPGIGYSKRRSEDNFGLLEITDGQYSSLFRGDQPVTAEIKYQIRRALSGCQIGTRILNSEGVVVLSTSDADHLGVSATPKEPGRYQAAFQIPGECCARIVFGGSGRPPATKTCVRRGGTEVAFEVTEEALWLRSTGG